MKYVSVDNNYMAARASSDLFSGKYVSGTHTNHIGNLVGVFNLYFPAMFICYAPGFDVNLNSWVSLVHASLLLAH